MGSNNRTGFKSSFRTSLVDALVDVRFSNCGMSQEVLIMWYVVVRRESTPLSLLGEPPRVQN